MAYTIRPVGSWLVVPEGYGLTPIANLRDHLDAAVLKHGTFRCDITITRTAIEIRMVRLLVAKPYCGQHAGPCQINPFTGERPRRKSRCLEANDWIEFHNLVNDVLDRLKVSADVWSKGADSRGRMFMRRVDLGRRRRWDYEDDGSRLRFGMTHNVWNLGTSDQFKEP
jgi:hypothetical protein